MSAIHLLISSMNDYLFEYPRFFSANRDLLNKHGIAMPWVEKDAKGDMWQSNLPTRLKQLEGNKSVQGEYLVRQLAGKQHILLCGTLGSFWNLPNLLKVVGSLPGWENFRTHILWLPAPMSLAIEGRYRIFSVEQRLLNIRAGLKSDTNIWIKKVENLLRQADTVKIIPDVLSGHILPFELLDGLQLPPLEELPTHIDDLRLNSPFLQLAATKLASMLAMDGNTVYEMLKPQDSPGMEYILPRELLNGYDQKYNTEINNLVSRFGASLNLSASGGENLQEAKTLLEEEWRDIAKMVINRLPEEKIPVARRIFDLAPQRMWPGFKRIEQVEPPLELDVLTMTKDHAKYILECMESVNMQRVNFPMRHIILDDGSIDGARDIIMNYAQSHPNVIPLFLGRPRPGGDNVRCLLESSHARYVALCEGDDYFTDPLKLQKQVDFLEKNRAFAMCFHPVKVTYEDGKPSRMYPEADALPNKTPKPFYSLRDLFFGNFIQTNSAVYRWRFRKGLPDWFVADLVPGDWYWHILHAETGLIGFLPELMSVYRRHGKALFATAEIDHIKHRNKFGLQELRLYDTLDRHFQAKFHSDFSSLATGVFADLLQTYIDTDNEATFNKACEMYPQFGREFLNELDKISHKEQLGFVGIEK